MEHNRSDTPDFKVYIMYSSISRLVGPRDLQGEVCGRENDGTKKSLKRQKRCA